MATIAKRKSGRWRLQVCRKGGHLSQTIDLRKDAIVWARQIERDLDLGISPAARKLDVIQTFGDLIDPHIQDMQAVGKPLLRSKAFCLEALKTQLGATRVADLDRQTSGDPCPTRARAARATERHALRPAPSLNELPSATAHS